MDNFVYIIAADKDGPVKIGVSQNPSERLMQLQTGNPSRLHLFSFFKARNRYHALSVEQNMRVGANALRLNGEWFDMPTWWAAMWVEGILAL